MDIFTGIKEYFRAVSEAEAARILREEKYLELKTLVFGEEATTTTVSFKEFVDNTKDTMDDIFSGIKEYFSPVSPMEAARILQEKQDLDLINLLFGKKATKTVPFIPYNSLKEFVDDFNSQSFAFRALALSSAFVFSYVLWRYTFNLFDKRRHHIELDKIKKSLALRRRNTSGVIEMLREENKCVVCLEDERQVITVSCGHYCVCAECADALPVPKKCPICRADVKHFMSVFNP